MAEDWSEADELLRDLGAVRAAADIAGASAEAKAAIDAAIRRAAEAVDLATVEPRNRTTAGETRRQIETARQAISALAAEIARSSRARAKASQAAERAARLLRGN